VTAARPGHVQRRVARLASPAAGPLLAVLVAPDGSGRTETLDALEEHLTDQQLRVVRITGRRADHDTPFAGLQGLLGDTELPPGKKAERRARDALRTALTDNRVVLVLDDAHWADAASLGVIAALVDEGGEDIGIVAAHRPVASDALGAFDAAMARRGVVVRLDPLTEDEVAERATALLGAPLDPAVADELLVRTGGHARLVDRLLASWRDSGALDSGAFVGSPDVAPVAVAESVRAATGELSPTAREALTALCVATAPDDELLAAVVGAEVGDVRAVFSELAAAGLLVPGHDEPVPLVADAVIAGHEAAAIRDVHRRLAELLAQRGAPAARVAEHLVAGGNRGPEAADALVAAGRAVLAEAPNQAAQLLDDAADAGADPEAIAGLRAEANALAGDEDRALIFANAVGDGPADSRARATVAMAGLLARRGLWGRSEQAYRAVHDHPTLPDDALAALAAVAAVALGRPSEPIVADAPPASLGADVARLLGRSAVAAGNGDGDGSLRAAEEAAELVAVAGTTVILPETPHAVGAVVALATGDVDNAERLVARALDVEAGGPAVSTRHHLLGGLAALRAGRWDQVHAALDATNGGATTRDRFLAGALRVGLARRLGDVGGLHDAWSALSGPLAAVHGDLFLLLPLAEVVVAAGRLGRRDQTRAREHELGVVLEGLGQPALWTRPLAWARVEAAVAAGDVDGVDSATADLAATGCAHERLEGLETAASAWRSVLDGAAAGSDALDDGVAALERAGLLWEASRLVGQAAIRADDPTRTRALLGRARELKGTLPVVDEAGVPVGTVLSAREQEVAACVLDGLTHKEIGAILFISPKTVEHHVARIRQKLGATTRAEMMASLRSTLDST